MRFEFRRATGAGAVIVVIGLMTGCASAAPAATSMPTLTAALASTVTPTVPAVTATPTPLKLTGSMALEGFAEPVSQLAWSPDGKLLATSAGGLAGDDPTVRLWQPDGTLVTVLNGHTGPVMSLGWSPDGQTLASGSLDGTVRLWGPDGRPRSTIETKAGKVFAVAWSPGPGSTGDGKTLASGSIVSFENPTVQLWHPDGTLIATMRTQYSGGKFYNLAWSPDGRWLAGGAVDYKLWRADGTEVFHVEQCASCTPAWGMAWSPDSARWAIGNESGGVSVYDTAGNDVMDLRDTNGNVDTLGWSPDGRVLAGGDGVVFWHADGISQSMPGASSQRVADVAWSPDGLFLASTSANGDIIIWGAGGTAALTLKGHSGPATRVAWSPDGKILASASDDKTVRLWSMSTEP